MTFILLRFLQINKNGDWTGDSTSDIWTKSFQSRSICSSHSNPIWSTKYDIRCKFYKLPSCSLSCSLVDTLEDFIN